MSLTTLRQLIRTVRRASELVVFMLTVLRIIAVQGLWADPEYTWRRNGVSWLTELLARDLPSVHVIDIWADQRTSAYKSMESPHNLTRAGCNCSLGPLLRVLQSSMACFAFCFLCSHHRRRVGTSLVEVPCQS